MIDQAVTAKLAELELVSTDLARAQERIAVLSHDKVCWLYGSFWDMNDKEYIYTVQTGFILHILCVFLILP